MHITKTMGIQLGLMITAFVIAVVAPPALAEDEPAGQTVEQKAQKRRGTGEDENIKSRSLENKADEQAPAPPSKGGDDAKTRGARGCFVVVDNWTPWKIQIFMDGQQNAQAREAALNAIIAGRLEVMDTLMAGRAEYNGLALLR